jgi:hypothetical protein
MTGHIFYTQVGHTHEEDDIDRDDCKNERCETESIRETKDRIRMKSKRIFIQQKQKYETREVNEVWDVNPEMIEKG